MFARFVLGALTILSTETINAEEFRWPSDSPQATLSVTELPTRIVQQTSEPAIPNEGLNAESSQMTPPQSFEAAFQSTEEPPAIPALPLCKIRIGAYGWLPEIHGQAGIGNVSTNVDVSTRDVLNFVEHNAHFIFAAQMEADYGPWSATASGMYFYAGYGNAIRRLNFSGNASLAIVDAVAGYEIEGLAQAIGLPQGSEFELLAGGRYWLLGGNVTATGPLGNSATRGRDVDWIDPVVGGRLTWAVQPDLKLRVRSDIGGFGWWNASDLTWNLEALLEKRCFEWCTIGAGYRILDVDYDRGAGRDRFLFDTQLRGPVATMTLDF